MRLLAVSDLHGFLDVCRCVLCWVGEHSVDVVVMAGDLLGVPDDYASVEEAQQASARQITEILSSLAIPILYLMGNDDQIQLSAPQQNFRSLHGVRINFGRSNFVGYQY